VPKFTQLLVVPLNVNCAVVVLPAAFIVTELPNVAAPLNVEATAAAVVNVPAVSDMPA
jgi:hypothetical protein